MDGPPTGTDGRRRRLLGIAAAWIVVVGAVLAVFAWVNRPADDPPAEPSAPAAETTVRGSHLTRIVGPPSPPREPAPFEYLVQFSADRTFASLTCPAEWRPREPTRAEVEACSDPRRTSYWRLGVREGFEISEWSVVRRLDRTGDWWDDFTSRMSTAISVTSYTIPQWVDAEPTGVEPEPCPEDPAQMLTVDVCMVTAPPSPPPPVPDLPRPGPTTDVEAPCRAARAGPSAVVRARGEGPAIAREVAFGVQFSVSFSDPLAEGEDDDSAMLAIEAAYDSPLQVGEAGCVVAALRPGEYSDPPLRVEVWPRRPADDRAAWQHEVDVDLVLPSGDLCFSSGEELRAACERVPPGRYRARISARGLETANHDGRPGQDRWRLRIWPSAGDIPPELRKAWPGWNG